MNYKKLIVESGLRLINSGQTLDTWGNISAIDRVESKVYITPSGMDYRTMEEEDVVVCDLEGNVIEGIRKPSIETGLHIGVYKNRPDANAIVHAHSIYSTVFSCMNETIPIVTDEAAQALHDEVRTADYALPGSQELVDACVKALGSKAKACLLKSHGSVCIGETMDKAFRVSGVLEMTAQIYQLIRSMGGEYEKISSENISTMIEMASQYGQKKE